MQNKQKKFDVWSFVGEISGRGPRGATHLSAGGQKTHSPTSSLTQKTQRRKDANMKRHKDAKTQNCKDTKTQRCKDAKTQRRIDA